jgi:iron complex outermembrane receptor protein
MRFFGQWRLGVSLVAVAVTLNSGAALAQAGDGPDAAANVGGLDEIIVTARFREEALQETPLAITAISADDLEARSVANVQDLGRTVPNAFITPGAAATGATPAIALRGVFQSDFNFAFEPGVAVYIDDVYHATLMGSAMDLMDLERVEVLRGPQGTLFGKNTLGGAIRLVSSTPQGDDSGRFSLAYGSHDRLEARGSADFSLVEDRVFMRISGAARRATGYQQILDFTCDMLRRGTPQLAGLGDGLGAGGVSVAVGSAADLAASLPSALIPSGDVATMSQKAQTQSCGLGETGGERLTSGRVMMRFLPSERLEINLAADYSDHHRDVNPDTLISVINPILSSPTAPQDFFFSVVRDELLANYGFVYDNRFIPSDPFTTYATNSDPITGRSNPNTASVESWGVQGTADYSFSDTVHGKVIIAHRQYDSQFSHDADVSPFGFGLNGNDIDHQQTTAEVQLQGEAFGDMLEWTVGGFMLNGESHLGGPIDYVTLHFLQNDTYKDRSRSAFAHGVLNLTDALSLTGGLRYTHNTKTFTFDHIGIGFPTLTQSATTERLDWTISLDYQVNDDLLLYGVVATGFRPRSVNPRPITPNQFQPIPGETLTSYELGVKGDFLDNMLRVNLAGFYSDYSSHLRQLNGFECFDPTLATVNLNVVFDPSACPIGTAPVTWFFYVGEQAEIYGLEGELVLQPADGLLLNAAFGYNHFTSNGTGPAFFDPSNRIQPRLNVSAGIEYGIDVPGGTLTPRLDWRYQSLMTYNPAPTTATNALFNVPGHSLFDARLTYATDDGWQASLAVTNLADKFYYNNKFTLTGFNVSGSPARPREWLLTVSREF